MRQDSSGAAVMPMAVPPATLLPLLRELGDLKRVRSADHDGSIAERLFVEAWSALVAGMTAGEVWPRIAAAALCATRLGDIDRAVLTRLGVPHGTAAGILGQALEEAAELLDPALQDVLRGAAIAERPPPASAPPFVARLARQPRAGVTCPGKPRVMLEPPENHAEHCLMVAVYGVALSPVYRADPTVVFLAALAHHLHNALVPDSGFAGEVLLGDELEPVFRRATEHALGEVPPALAEDVRAACRILPDAGTPEGSAFHAADTLDRVLQIEQHLRAGSTSMHYVLHDMALVHEGPVKPFQDRLLAAMGLMA